MEPYSTWPFVTRCFHSAWYFQGWPICHMYQFFIPSYHIFLITSSVTEHLCYFHLSYYELWCYERLHVNFVRNIAKLLHKFLYHFIFLSKSVKASVVPHPWKDTVILQMKNKVGKLTFPNFKTYYKAAVIKIVWYWLEDWYIDQWHRLGPEINHYMYVSFMFRKGSMKLQ